MIYAFIYITAVGSIDTSGISTLEEVKKNADRKGLKVYIYIYRNCDN